MVTLALAPASLMAGGYGNTAVMDESVSQYAAAGETVWCPRLNDNIPARLGEQMDCGGPGRVVKARRGLGGILSSLRHNPGGFQRQESDGGDARPLPKVATLPKDDSVTPEPTPSSVAKWDRLGEMNVTRENFGNQSQEFQHQVLDYLSSHGPNSDWSGFNPK